LIVVVGLFAVLLGLLLPAVQRVRAAAARAACANNLRQLGLASHSHHGQHGRLPPALKPAPSDPLYHLSWLARLLPDLGEGPLWQTVLAEYAANPRPLRRPRHTALGRVVTAYACPADPVAREAWPLPGSDATNLVAFTSYLGNIGRSYRTQDGVVVPVAGVALTDITDGTANTLLAGERPPSADRLYGWWYAARGQGDTGSLDYVLGAAEVNGVPASYPQYRRACGGGPFGFAPPAPGDICSVFRFGSHHPGGANLAFCDGSVRFLPYSADTILPALATRAGGESVQLPD
jgi:prepilin-type processing-associated H-X9-DG protein